jgi:outer membrane protein TolC
MRTSFLLLRCFTFLVIVISPRGAGYVFSEEGEKLSLNRALELAYQQNPRMVEARNTITAARGRKLTESTFANPEVGFSIGGLRKEEGGERDTGLKQFSVIQEFDPLAVLWLKSRIARNEIASAEYALKGVWSEVYRAVRDSYYTVQLKAKEIEVAEDNLNVLRRFLDRVALRFQVGEVLRNDLQRAKVEVLQGENQVLIAGKELQSSRAEFNLLLGREMKQEYSLSDAPEYKELKTSLDEMLAVALAQRPDLKRGRTALDSTDKELLKEKFSILPAPFVGFERELEDFDNDYKILLGFTMPFWNWNAGEIQRARAERTIAENDLFALQRAVSLEVYNAFLEAQLADRQMGIASKALTEAHELLRLADLRYGEGKISYLDYIDQVKTVTQTRLNYSKSIFNFNQRVTKLEQATYSSVRNEKYLK